MASSLRLEIEFLTGAYRGTDERASDRADWPPQPDRVFSALVSAWAARGEAPQERAALEWLERQEPPTIHAKAAYQQSAPEVFVPPNDDRASKTARAYERIMPDRRRRQPRRFPAARPEDPTLVMAWSALPDDELVGSLRAIARDIPYVGHSASFVRCDFTVGEAASPPLPEGDIPERSVYPGRMEELETAYRANPVRPRIAPGAATRPAPAPEPAPAAEWLVLQVTSDWHPDLLGASLLCRDLRNALMSGYAQTGLGERIPEIVSGHAPDGRPTRHSHVAVVPMAFVGREHATGGVRGFAFIPPSGEELTAIPGFREAFEAVAPFVPDDERRSLTLQFSREGPPIRLSPAERGTPRSLSSLSAYHYRKPSCRWATVTPIVLDRHLKKFCPEEKQAILATSCSNAGLPKPRRILVGRHSAVIGAPSVVTARDAPRWTKWRVPESLRTRALVHAVFEFDDSVKGPVMLGAGRFTGLGLCRRLDG